MNELDRVTVYRARRTLREIDERSLAGLDERDRACAMAYTIGELRQTVRALLELVDEGDE